MSEAPILVLGASGTTGRRVTSALRRGGHLVRSASRSGEARFDWSAPDTWEPALTGATGLYLMAPDGVPVAPAFVALAVERGVRHIVLLSSSGVEEMDDQRLLAAEQTVRNCGADWTILRPGWFNQNFDEGFFCPSVMAGEVVMPVGDLRQAFTDAGDIAAVAATVLTGTGHSGQTYELRGPRAVTFTEAVAIISRASGRDVRFSGTAEAYLAAQVANGIPQEAALSEVAAFTALRRRGDDEPNDLIRQVTGHGPTTFEAYALDAAARGAWRS